MQGELIWHWMQPCDAQSIPRRHIFLDVATAEHRKRGFYLGQWGGGAAVFQSHPKGRKLKEHSRAYDTMTALWHDVDEWAIAKHRTVLWAWDLGVVLRLSGAFSMLPRLGWEITGWSVMPQGCWFVWRNGNRTITMCDVPSVFPFGWSDVEVAFGSVVRPIPENMTEIPARVSDCLKRATTLRRGIGEYLAWIERERLGPWRLTAASQGFAAYRSRFYTDPLLIHWDEDARAAERRAMWAGRTEAYWHGTKRGTRVDEWDLTLAYPRICERDALPTELVREYGPEIDLSRWLYEDGYEVLAEGEVRTKVPVVPTSHDGRILWPVGTFDSVLWGPELRLLHDVAGTFTVRRAWVYRTATALQEWASWLAAHLDVGDTCCAAWQKAILKQWSVSSIGHLGMQHGTWELVGKMPRVGIRWWTQKDMDTGEVSDLVHVGTELWESGPKIDWSMSVIAVPSWVASRARENLTRLWLALGERVALYADTDSLLVEGKHARTVQAVAMANPHLGLRLKRSWRRITILGPRQIITGDRVRVSGVPVRAQLLADGSVSGEVRESLGVALKNARPAQVKVTPRRWHLREVDRRRLVGADGWTEAVRLPA